MGHKNAKVMLHSKDFSKIFNNTFFFENSDISKM